MVSRAACGRDEPERKERATDSKKSGSPSASRRFRSPLRSARAAIGAANPAVKPSNPPGNAPKDQPTAVPNAPQAAHKTANSPSLGPPAASVSAAWLSIPLRALGKRSLAITAVKDARFWFSECCFSKRCSPPRERSCLNAQRNAAAASKPKIKMAIILNCRFLCLDICPNPYSAALLQANSHQEVLKPACVAA